MRNVQCNVFLLWWGVSHKNILHYTKPHVRLKSKILIDSLLEQNV